MASPKSKERIAIIELMRFLFAVAIVLFHSSVLRQPEDIVIMPNGYIGVEFFFLLSGFLMARSAVDDHIKDKNAPVGTQTILFIKKKVMSFYPYYVFAFIVTFLIYPNIFAGPTQNFLLRCEEALWELLLVKRVGLGNMVWLNGATWYLSAMVFCMFLIYPLMCKKRDIFVHIIAPVLSVFSLGILYLEGGLQITGELFAGSYRSLVRAFAELSLGCICFEISSKLQEQTPRGKTRIFFTVVEILCYLTALIYATCWNGNTRMDYLILLFLAIGITISFSGYSCFSEVKAGAFTTFLGKFSLCIYLNHRGYCWYLREHPTGGGYIKNLLCYIVLTVLTASTCMFTVDRARCFLKSKGSAREGKSYEEDV